MSSTIPLSEIAHARSGDKGNHANVGVIAWTDAGYEYLGKVLTESRVAEFFLPLRPKQVQRYELPGIRYRLKGETDWSVIDLPKTAVADRFTRAVADFLDCIDSGTSPIATGADGLRSLEIIEAAYRSVESGCAEACRAT